MNCNYVTEKLELFLDEEIPNTEMEGIRQHLLGCEECAKKVETEKHFKQSLRENLGKKLLETNLVDDMKEFILNKN
ncbi:MAG: zf-HC2 domain-containing protein [Bacteroidetes bacterium]|nr:zf-HC2 domain-containing protein [Bacteroidota bacterium]